MRLQDISFQVCNFSPNLLYCNIYEILVITNVFILIMVQIKFTNNKKSFRFYAFIIKYSDYSASFIHKDYRG